MGADPLTPLPQIEHGISTSSYATKWYITLYANSVPFGTQLRFWDALLLEGVDFLVIAAVGIIWAFRGEPSPAINVLSLFRTLTPAQLVSTADFASPQADFESILATLSSYFFVESDDAVLRWIRKTLRRDDVRKKMKGWRKDWEGFVRDGSSMQRIT